VPDADVVIATWWETAEWVAGLSASKGSKAYFIQHHEIHDGQPKERVAETWRLPMHKITISKWLSDTNERVYGLGPLPVIHNSVDMGQFHAAERSRGEPPTVGLLYSKTYWKGVGLSFRAIEIARQQFPDLRVVMFGAEGEQESLPLPAGAELVVRPAQDRIREIYGRCDVWLCGSLAEGFHLPPLEAMACRVPVVSTEVGGPMDIVREGENGFLSPVGDAESLGANLVRALELSAGEWKAMSNAALRTATDYTWDDATDHFEAELARIVAAGPLDRAV
jgi:glycosyltransferase involved in cell wall biosynthesis